MYFVRRLSLALPTVFLVTLITFAAIRLLPGDASNARLGEAWTASAANQIRSELGLDDPWYQQYGRWLWDMAHLDFGSSSIGNVDIRSEIGPRLQVTGLLAFYSLALAVTIGVPVGVLSALRQQELSDYALRTLAVGALSVPGFFLATLLLAYRPLGWVPPLGQYVSPWDDPIHHARLMIVPAVLLSLPASASLMRHTRTMMLEVLRQDYVRTAHAKGLAGRRVIIIHALRNALIPVVTVLGLQVVALMGGTVIYESIFGIPGMGTYLIQAATQRDYPSLQAITVVAALIVLVVNLLVDLVYMRLDPRIWGSS
jgi:peptide/nickel transport system permease protein